MKRVTFGNYAGVRIKGTVPIYIDTNNIYHLDRAEWLTAQVECGGKFGSVQNYDGTGMTAGLHQAIAVYPKMAKQGPLFRLLQAIQGVTTEANRPALFDAIQDREWELADNVLCYAGMSVAVSRVEIRNEFTGNKLGLMPVRGSGRERAERWTRLFHKCFIDPVTFSAQKEAGIEWIESRTKNKLYKSEKFKNKTIETAIYDGMDIAYVEIDEIMIEKDLALAVYWSHSVNAPAIAFRRLCKAADEANPIDKPREFAKALIRRLGKAQYGRWHHSVKNGRYQRTRRAALKLWPKELFTGKGAIMPTKF